MSVIKRFEKLDFCEREALRYLRFGQSEADERTHSALEEVKKEAEAVLAPSVCYLQADVCGNCVGGIFVGEKSAGRFLSGCRRAVVFAATLGIGIDRLLSKYGQTDAFKCALLQAVGAAYAESLCDAFCSFLQENRKEALGDRFSPGYGDFPLQAQREIFALLSPERAIGLTLNESLLMSPSKSVTAIVGWGAPKTEKGCASCQMQDCDYRKDEK